ncbi:hypothetical protein ACH4E7_07750 [Kitasatospora sp. NPDC018058]|uniref:hypothetical protein n=1 Tax=Kitasatospora sp. NPDC018058 TaxID=3364025 RepID=UPI0037C12E87
MARPGDSNQEARIEGYLDRARLTYGTLEDPDFSFTARAFNEQPYRDLVAKLAEIVKVEDMTDLNDNTCFDYGLIQRRAEWKLKLSMVGPYAMLTRVTRGWPRRFRILSVEVVEEPTAGTEQAIVELVREAGFTMISAADAEYSVRFAADPGAEPVDGPLYRVLFSTIPEEVEDLSWRYRY